METNNTTIPCLRCTDLCLQFNVDCATYRSPSPCHQCDAAGIDFCTSPHPYVEWISKLIPDACRALKTEQNAYLEIYPTTNAFVAWSEISIAASSWKVNVIYDHVRCIYLRNNNIIIGLSMNAIDGCRPFILIPRQSTLSVLPRNGMQKLYNSLSHIQTLHPTLTHGLRKTIFGDKHQRVQYNALKNLEFFFFS